MGSIAPEVDRNGAAYVASCLRETTGIIERWIKEAEQDGACPVWRFSSSDEMRKQVSMPALGQDGCEDQTLFEHMKMVLRNSVNPWTGRFVDKLYTAPLAQGPAYEALLAAINANAHIFSAAPMLCLAEEACVEGLAKLCGWNTDAADGLTMPGGSTSNTFAIQTALNTLLPAFKQDGIVGVCEHIQKQQKNSQRSAKACRPLIFTGQEAHYSLEKAAIACGLGLQSVVKVPCDESGAMDVAALEALLNQAYDNAQPEQDGQHVGVVGWPIFVNATAGSTVTGSFDALDRIADVCQRYSSSRSQQKLWLHVDGSWGGPVLFSEKHKGRMQGVQRCDSLTINPHKLLNVPHQCSFAVFRNGDALANNALNAPYLFHETAQETTMSGGEEALNEMLLRKRRRRESPAMMNFGCGRRGDALKFYLAWLAQGSQHFERQVNEGIAKAERIAYLVKHDAELCKRLELSRGIDDANVIFLQVCLRPRLSDEASVEQKSKATQYVYATLRQRKRFAVDFAPLGKGQGDFVRMVTHPSSSIETLIELVHEIASIGDGFKQHADA